MSEIEVKCTGYYPLPFLPIIGVFCSTVKPSKVYLWISTPSLLPPSLLVPLVHYVSRKFNGKEALEDLEVCYDGMADAFKGVVMLLVAAGVGVFALAITSIGAIDNLLHLAETAGRWRCTDAYSDHLDGCRSNRNRFR